MWRSSCAWSCSASACRAMAALVTAPVCAAAHAVKVSASERSMVPSACASALSRARETTPRSEAAASRTTSWISCPLHAASFRRHVSFGGVVLPGLSCSCSGVMMVMVKFGRRRLDIVVDTMGQRALTAAAAPTIPAGLAVGRSVGVGLAPDATFFHGGLARRAYAAARYTVTSGARHGEAAQRQVGLKCAWACLNLMHVLHGFGYLLLQTPTNAGSVHLYNRDIVRVTASRRDAQARDSAPETRASPLASCV